MKVCFSEAKSVSVENGGEDQHKRSPCIAASLPTGLRSDLPGQVTAGVTEAVYDSPLHLGFTPTRL